MDREPLKLVFPGGEHPQVILNNGVNRVGRDPQAQIVIDRAGVRPQHCELHVSDVGVMLQVPADAQVQVNERAVDGMIALRAGDTLSIGGVQARLMTIDVPHLGPAAEGLPVNDAGATAVRAALPRFVLRCVAGEAFGRSFPVVGQTVLGRAAECNLRFDHTGLSRQHARLVPAEDGLHIEDLRSTNGSFINGRRVSRGVAKPGDELGFDTLRFRLLSTGQLDSVPSHDEEPPKVHSRTFWVTVAIAAIGVAAAAWWLLA
ncbi:MAG TPA: FHA domain-containing protein [Lysobacter sp.]|nr:FHA domain-containing protein [Lysobacter sp.]